MKLYTAICDYGATGEGSTYMMMIHPGYGMADPTENVRQAFAQRFGGYMASGVDVHEGVYLDFSWAKLVLPDSVRDMLKRWETMPDSEKPGNFVWTAELHMNFS